MKQTKYRFEQFAFYDFGAVQTHLEEMAAGGWMIEKPGSCFGFCNRPTGQFGLGLCYYNSGIFSALFTR